MTLSPELKSFIREHLNDDTDRLLLAASRFPGIDVTWATRQILARRQLKDKLPYWYTLDDLIYPSRLSAEQCSSEQTALYKQALLKGNSFCDLTGGLGVDCYYFSQKARIATYVERFPEYCEAARNNFTILQAEHIRVINADAREVASSLQADTFYIDPARRSTNNKRAFALADYEPDILQLKPILLEHSGRLIIKISPMADLGETLRLLPETREIHILSSKNECKELLFLLETPVFYSQQEKVKIFAINLQPGINAPAFTFNLQEEKDSPLITTDTLNTYLYEPHTALLKSGAFKLIAVRYGLYKLHRHSHLYTSPQLIPDFPGRCFIVDETFEFSGKLLKQISRQVSKANLTVRNFPLSVAELRARSGIKEGGDVYLFATTLANEKKVLVKTHKINPDFQFNNSIL